MTTFAAEPPPAGGAALAEVLGASVAVGVVTSLLLLLGWAHRTRRTTLLARAADRVGAPMGLPGWVALPTVICTTALLTALFGMLWDISLHIGQGRDEGPRACGSPGTGTPRSAACWSVAPASTPCSGSP